MLAGVAEPLLEVELPLIEDEIGAGYQRRRDRLGTMTFQVSDSSSTSFAHVTGYIIDNAVTDLITGGGNDIFLAPRKL